MYTQQCVYTHTRTVNYSCGIHSVYSVYTHTADLMPEQLYLCSMLTCCVQLYTLQLYTAVIDDIDDRAARADSKKLFTWITAVCTQLYTYLP